MTAVHAVKLPVPRHESADPLPHRRARPEARGALESVHVGVRGGHVPRLHRKETLLRLHVGRDRPKQRRLRLVGAVRAAEALDGGIGLPARFQEVVDALTAILRRGTGTIAARVPDLKWLRDLLERTGPLISTSANRSGHPATTDPAEVERTLGDDIDLLIDAGSTRGGPPSTIVDLTGSAPRLVRAGAIPWNEVQTCVDRG